VKRDRRYLHSLEVLGGGGNTKTSARETSYPAEIKNGYVIDKCKELPLHGPARFRMEYQKKIEKMTVSWPIFKILLDRKVWCSGNAVGPQSEAAHLEH
jgi:hypothetical protein